jgi:hypothetical protein
VAEAKDLIRATAAKVGNGAHVILPKDWLGRDVVCVPADRLVAFIANLHGRAGTPPPARFVTDGSLAYTRTKDGWQVLASANREAKAAQVWLAEQGWRAYSVQRLEGRLVLESGGDHLAVPAELEPWVAAVLAGEGMSARDLPSLDSGTALQRIRKRLQTETDPARLRALAHELSRLLGD